MASKNPKVRALKKADIIAFYDKPFQQSIRGITVELDGEPVAVAGVLDTQPLQAISYIHDKLRKFPKIIVQTGKKFVDILDRYESAVYAFADEEEKNASNFLRHIGFTQIDDGVFKWQK